MRKRIRSSYYYILPLLIVGISYGYTSFLLALLALIPLLFTTTRHTLAIFFFIYGGSLGGVIRAMYPFLPLYGLMIVLFGFLLMWDLVVDLFKNHIRAIGGIIITLAFFAVFYFLGPQDENAMIKYSTMCTHGFMMVLGYYAFERSSKIDVEGLTLLLLVASICMFAYVISAANIKPTSLMDYNWFRDQLLVVYRLDDDKLTIVNYQQIGMLTLFGLAIFLSHIKFDIVKVVFYLLCSSQLVLTSGCRQAIFGVALIIALRFVVFRLKNVYTKKIIIRLSWTIVGLAFAYFALLYALQNIGSETVETTITEGDYQRERIFGQALFLFQTHPLTGVGLGGYYYWTGDIYPHNFFLELLCETGIVGTVVALLLLIIPLIIKRQGILHITASNQFFFLIMMGTIVRVMVSSDFTESIELFSAIFAISAAKKLGNLPPHKNKQLNFIRAYEV